MFLLYIYIYIFKVTQSCPILCDPMDYMEYSPILYGILQARVLEWVAFPFSRGSSQPRGWTGVSRLAGGFFTSWATREAQNLTLVVCLLLPLKREIKCLTRAACFLRLETPGLPAGYPLFPPLSSRRIMSPKQRAIISKLVRQHILLTLIFRVSDPGTPRWRSSWRKMPQW